MRAPNRRRCRCRGGDPDRPPDIPNASALLLSASVVWLMAGRSDVNPFQEPAEEAVELASLHPAGRMGEELGWHVELRPLWVPEA